MKLIQNEPVSKRNTRELDENSKKCQLNWILEPISCFHLPLLILAKNTDSQPLDIKCLCSTLVESGKMLGFPQKNVKKRFKFVYQSRFCLDELLPCGCMKKLLNLVCRRLI